MSFATTEKAFVYFVQEYFHTTNAAETEHAMQLLRNLNCLRSLFTIGNNTPNTVKMKDDDGAVLWHCTQGKDRAGCASALLLAALGADRQLIMKDFILSRDNYQPLVDKIPAQTEAQKNVLNTLVSANPVIFEAALDSLDHRYGSLDNYLRDVLGITDSMKIILRKRYLD